MRGDRVVVTIQPPGRRAEVHEIIATKAGRRVERVVEGGVLKVSEVRRTGSVVYAMRFPMAEVLCVEEYHAKYKPEPIKKTRVDGPPVDGDVRRDAEDRTRRRDPAQPLPPASTRDEAAFLEKRPETSREDASACDSSRADDDPALIWGRVDPLQPPEPCGRGPLTVPHRGRLPMPSGCQIDRRARPAPRCSYHR
ncbi:hypothetical protein [Actinomadura atramentaria]|uniref:hypothetical protein n=1 Tax=Actinomadura atramentaria TaxID=1990 RepID=UPI00035CFF79|nr:hypothetical protein [Actinomadura atramentaria]